MSRIIAVFIRKTKEKQWIMDKDFLINYVKNKYKVVPDKPFEGDFESMVFRHKDNKKWFALLMIIEKNKLRGAEGSELCEVLNVKCDPLIVGGVINGVSVFPAYHMNRTHWVSLYLPALTPDELYFFLDMSYTLTAAKGRVKK